MEHLIDVGVGQGCDAHCHVAEHLDHGAAQDGQHQRAEGGVVGDSDDHFHAVADLLLDEVFRGVPGDAGVG